MRASAVGAIAWLVAACDMTAPLPAGAAAIDPPAQYARWWSMVQECSGITRHFSRVSWYMVEGGSFEASDGELVDGLFFEGPDRIILAEPVILDGAVVRHEMLHALIRRNDDAVTHPAEFFLTRCGGIVDCRSKCIATSGRRAAMHGANTVEASVLQVAVAVDSVVHRGSPDYGYMHVVVTARNPLGVPIRVELDRFRHTFALSLEPPWQVSVPFNGHDVAFSDDDQANYFAPGETKQHLFDIFLPVSGAATTNLLGPWAVAGGFTSKWVKTPATFQLVP